MDKDSFVKMLTDRIIDHEASPLSTALMFWNNKKALDKTGDWTKDKRFHARANAQAGQIFDPATALGISLGREVWDLIRKNKSKPQNATRQSIWDDSKNDWEADSYGLMRGLLNPFSNVDDILDYKYLDSLNY